MAAYLAMWGLFTAVMFIATLRLHVAGQVVFGSLTILFFLLAIGDYTNASAFKHFTGYEGIFCGSPRFPGLAQVLNEIFGKTVCHLGSEEINSLYAHETHEKHETNESFIEFSNISFVSWALNVLFQQTRSELKRRSLLPPSIREISS